MSNLSDVQKSVQKFHIKKEHHKYFVTALKDLLERMPWKVDHISEAIAILEAAKEDGDISFENSMIVSSAVAIAIEEYSAGVARWVIDRQDGKDVRLCLHHRKFCSYLMWEIQSYHINIVHKMLKG